MTPANDVNCSHMEETGPPNPYHKELGTESHRQVTGMFILGHSSEQFTMHTESSGPIWYQVFMTRTAFLELTASLPPQPALWCFPTCLHTCSHPDQHLGSPGRKAG